VTISELEPGDVVRVSSVNGCWMFTGQNPYGGIVSRYLMVRVDVWPLVVKDFDEDASVHSRMTVDMSGDEIVLRRDDENQAL